MSPLRARIAAMFVEPVGSVASGRDAGAASDACNGSPAGDGRTAARGCADQPAAAALVVGVVARPADVRVAAGAVALGLVRRCKASAGVVCVWTAGGDGATLWRAPAAPAAAQLARALGAAGNDVGACGRLVIVRLPAQEEAAVAAARAAAHAAAAVPVVIGIGAPRGDAFDQYLGSVDLAVVALAPGQDDRLRALALAGLSSRGGAAVLELPGAHVARVVAGAGAGLLSALDKPVAQVVDILP